MLKLQLADGVPVPAVASIGDSAAMRAGEEVVAIGGPLLNMQGEVIGMNVAKIDTASVSGASVSGLNFAIDDTSFLDLLMQHRSGDTASVEVQRQREAATIDVSLGERPDQSQA